MLQLNYLRSMQIFKLLVPLFQYAFKFCQYYADLKNEVTVTFKRQYCPCINFP